jgi:hypothetical protein
MYLDREGVLFFEGMKRSGLRSLSALVCRLSLGTTQTPVT